MVGLIVGSLVVPEEFGRNDGDDEARIDGASVGMPVGLLVLDNFDTDMDGNNVGLFVGASVGTGVVGMLFGGTTTVKGCENQSNRP